MLMRSKTLLLKEMYTKPAAYHQVSLQVSELAKRCRKEGEMA
jgi:hypothetical protein